MNTCTIIPEDKNSSLTLIALQVVSVLGAGVFLYTSRFYFVAVVPAMLLLGMAVLLACYSRHRLFSILLIGLFTSLILSLRFEFLTWGDPWFDYGMVQRIIAYQSIDPSVYSAQLPVIHLIITTSSLFSGINSLDLLKFVIPPLSVIGLYAIYRFTKDISSNKTAFFAGILLLCGTPYLHWTTQGIRETLGIALFGLALYVSFSTIQSQKRGYLFISLALIGGLVLTHDLSSIMFLVVWITISVTYLYLICDIDRIRTTGLFSLIIASSTVIFILTWWVGHREFAYYQFYLLMNMIFHSEYGIHLFIVSLISLYLIPLMIPDKILLLRSMVNKILIRKKQIYAVLITGAIVCSIVVLNFILSKSSIVLTYPLPMLFNGICMIVLSLIGIYYFLDKDRLHILAWIAILTLILVLSMSEIVPFVDPLRFMEFLYIPLAIIAAFGMTRMAGLIVHANFFSIVLVVFVIASIVTAFPPVLFFGEPFEAGHPLYDTRSWVIQHQSSEISAISWLNNSNASGVIKTDAYVGYAARGIILKNSLTIISASFIRDWGYPQSFGTDTQYYMIILSRMTKYLEFSEQWLMEKNPLSDTDLKKIDNDYNRLYDNGNAVIYSFSIP